MKTSEEFNWWLTCIPDKIAELKQRLPASIADKLDNSIESVDILEHYLMNIYESDNMIKPENSEFLDQLASYIGDIAEKKMTGSFWTINLDDPKDVDYRFPILKFRDKRPSFNPFTYITTSLDRKKGNLLSSAILRRASN